MNFRLETPAAVLKAREAQRGWNWILEVLVFGAVFFTVSIAESLVMIPGIAIAIAANPAVLSAAMSGDACGDELGRRDNLYVICESGYDRSGNAVLQGSAETEDEHARVCKKEHG